MLFENKILFICILSISNASFCIRRNTAASRKKDNCGSNMQRVKSGFKSGHSLSAVISMSLKYVLNVNL